MKLSSTFHSKRHLKQLRFDSELKSDYLGILILALGTILCGLVIYGNFQSLKHIQVLEKQLELAKAHSTEVSNSLIKENPQQLEAMQKISQQLNYDWGNVFSTLEATYSEGVYLLAIEPDKDKNEILVSAQAVDSAKMLDYIRLVEASQHVNHIELLSQEVAMINQKDAVAFSVVVKLN